MTEPPRATNIVRPEDVPVCPDCGSRTWLDRRCLSCPTGVMPGDPPARTCGTCRHWVPGAQASLYPWSADPAYGNCGAIGDADRLDPELSDLAVANNGDGTVASWLETRAEFGCVLHSPKDHP